MPLEAVGERGEPAVDEIVTRRDAGGTGRTQFAARVSKAKAKIEARLDYVPAVDEQHRDAAVSRHDRVNPVRDHFEQPRRALDYCESRLQSIRLRSIATLISADAPSRRASPRVMSAV